MTAIALGDVPASVVTSDLDRGYLIPVSLAQKSLFSPYTEAWDCFTQQGFSKNLQLFLVSYVMTTSGYYSVYVS